MNERWRISFTDGKEVEVKVWEGRDGYKEALRGADREELSESHACFKASPVRANSRKVGEVHLVKGNFGAGVVAHECMHAVLHWLDYLPAGAEVDDETLCTQLGRLVSKFWTEYYTRLNNAEGKEEDGIRELKAAG